jgi:hypothetical protein
VWKTPTDPVDPTGYQTDPIGQVIGIY